MNNDQIKEFTDYVNRYGYFNNGRLMVDINGEAYDVEAVMKTLHNMNLI